MKNKEDYKLLTEAASKQTKKAIGLVKASLDTVKPYNEKKEYSPKELEPYDALCDRFVRAIESSVKFFRTYELFLHGENSDNLRDLLHRMEKCDLVTEVPKWISMRNIRNRIVHDYSPEQIKAIYEMIMSEFGKELLRLEKHLKQLKLKA